MCIMGCSAGKVTPAESLQTDKKRIANVSSNAFEDVDSPADSSMATQNQPRMYRKPPPLSPKRVPLADPFQNDKNEESTDKEIPQNSINSSSFLSPPPSTPPHTIPMFHPAAPFIASSLKNTREASASQIDFFKMLDKKIEEGPDYKEK